MANFTSNTYQMKRKILTFSNKISRHLEKGAPASRKDIYLVLVYGIIGQPMMLATNKEIKSKDDVIRVARTYFLRWK